MQFLNATTVVVLLVVVHLVMLGAMSELVRQLLLWPFGRRPRIRGGASWWTVYGINPEDPALTMEDLFAQDKALGERIRGSWFPSTDGMRRADVLAAAVNDWHDRTMRRLREQQVRAEAERQRAYDAQQRQREAAWTAAQESEDQGRRGPGSQRPAADGSTDAATGTMGWWTVLGVARTAPWAEVKHAYRALRSVHSAYLRGTATEEEASRSHPAMLRLNEAFSAARQEMGQV